jgi:chemotaxis protein MotB
MRATSRKTIALLISLVSLSLLSGCTNWQKKYQALLVQYENCKGQVDYERGEKSQLANRISQDQQTIEELQRQIEEKRKTPAVATGCGEGYDVAFDPNAGTITVTLPNAILFDSGKATLKTATSRELDHIYSVLQDKYRGKQIDVVGHTDTDPIRKTKDKWKDNWELSAERALTVTRYLIKRGIPVDKIRAIGCGESRPIASNSTVSGKAKNRRVEIVVHIRG